MYVGGGGDFEAHQHQVVEDLFEWVQTCKMAICKVLPILFVVVVGH